MELDAKDASQSESMLKRLSAWASEDVVGQPPPPTTPTPAREYWLSSNCWPWLVQKLLLLPIVGAVIVVLRRACWKYTPGVKDDTGLRLLSPCVDDKIDAAALMVCALLG